MITLWIWVLIARYLDGWRNEQQREVKVHLLIHLCWITKVNILRHSTRYHPFLFNSLGTGLCFKITSVLGRVNGRNPITWLHRAWTGLHVPVIKTMIRCPLHITHWGSWFGYKYRNYNIFSRGHTQSIEDIKRATNKDGWISEWTVERKAK